MCLAIDQWGTGCMRKIVVAVQTKRHYHLSCQNLPKDRNPPIETDMGPLDTKYPAKIRELDVHHINIAYHAVYDVICDVAVGKKNHACGGGVQGPRSKPKRKHHHLYFNPLP